LYDSVNAGHDEIADRQAHMRSIVFLLAAFLWQPITGGAAEAVPQTVTETWAEFDARAEPLEVEVVREETVGGITTRYVRFVVGTFAGKKTWVAAFYAFPEGAGIARGHPTTRERVPNKQLHDHS
jgi:hypothetical protein